jgi:4-hydroxybenzoate polyprenyltransferase
VLVSLLAAMRPHQWVKNLLVFAPVLFSHRLGDPGSLRLAATAFGIFCLLSSAVYLVNDVIDRESDRAHPRKQHRPIASGRLPVPFALAAAAAFAATALGGASSMVQHEAGIPFFAWPLAYVALNLAYSTYLKHHVIVDCLSIALGFHLRVHAGSVAIGVESSSWILLCTFFFALFLAFCKRREEVARWSDGTGATRATMKHYTLHFLDQLIPPLAALSILTYALYTVAPETVATHHTRNLMFTVPIVVFGVFRYLFLVHERGEGADPARLLFRDLPLVLSGLLWIAAVTTILNAASP